MRLKEWELFKLTHKRKSLVWVIEGSLSGVLHKEARLSPASFLCRLGWEVTMITSGVPSGEFDDRIKFVLVRWPRVYMLGPIIYHLSILWTLLSGRVECDVLMYHTDSAPFLLPITPFLRLTSLRETEIVMDTRSMVMDADSYRGRLRAFSFRLGHWMARHMPIGQTAITNEMVRTLGIPRRQLLGIWPSGANVTEFRVSAARRRWPKPEDPVRLIYLGVLRPERNLIDMINAVLLAQENGLNVTLEVVGSGPQQPELELYAKTRGNGAIKISPRVKREEVPNVLARADVGLLPFPDLPEFRVSCAIKLFEYMSAGMAILATRIVAHEDILDGSPFVFWAKDATPESLASAIREICFRKDSLPQMGARAAAYAKEWTWEASAERLSEALRKTLHSD